MQLQMAQPQQQEPQESPQQGKRPFPADKDEAMTFSNDLLEILHGEKTHQNIISQLSNVDESNKGDAVGIIAANIVGNRVADVRGQTGRKIEMKLVVNALKAVINETSEMGEDNGFFKMGPKDKGRAAKMAISILDKLGTGNKEQKQPQQAQPVQMQPPGGAQQ